MNQKITDTCTLHSFNATRGLETSTAYMYMKSKFQVLFFSPFQIKYFPHAHSFCDYEEADPWAEVFTESIHH